MDNRERRATVDDGWVCYEKETKKIEKQMNFHVCDEFMIEDCARFLWK